MPKKPELLDEDIEYRDFAEFMELSSPLRYSQHISDELPPSERKKMEKKIKENK